MSPVDSVALLNGVDMAGVFAVEDAAVVLPCLHHYGKVCQLIGTVVNIQTIEIVFEDALGGIPLGVAHAGVNLHQNVKGVHQNMPGTHAGVDEGQVLRVQSGVLLADVCQLCLHLRLLRGFVQIILPVFPQIAVRVTLYPQAAKAVFHHVADDPVRGEQLGHRRDLLFGDLAVFGKGSGFGLGVVVLIQPADDLHLTALLDVEVLFRDIVGQLVHHALLIHHRKVQQDFGIIGGLFKQTGQDLIQRIALLDEQKAEQLVQLVVLLPLDDPGFFLGGKGQVGIKGGGDQIRLHLAALGAKHPQVGGQIVVDLHEPHSDQAVEPCVCNLFHNILIGSPVVRVFFLIPDHLNQLPPLLDGLACHQIRLRCANIVKLGIQRTLGQRVCNALFSNAHQSGTVADICDQLVPCPDGKVFNGCFVHGYVSARLHQYRF